MQRYEFFLIFVLYNTLNMAQITSGKTLWNIAGKAGLALGAVSTAYLFATQLLGNDLPAFVTSLLSFILWAAKFAGCILIMREFMKLLVKANPDATNSDTLKLGLLMSILSAFVYAGFSLANVVFISPDVYAESMDAMMQQMAPMLDSNSMAVLDQTMQNLPQITFFSNLIYCFIYGAILSAILSRRIPSRDPFADYKPDQQ